MQDASNLVVQMLDREIEQLFTIHYFKTSNGHLDVYAARKYFI